MIRKRIAVTLLAFCAGCTVERSENSAICGMTMLASATRVMDLLTTNVLAVLSTPPEDLLRTSRIPVRVVGFGTTAAMTGVTEDGGVVVGYEGEGFPERPGFGVALVDDSSEVFRGILIWDKEPPPNNYARIGAISGSGPIMPLVGMRINWASVSSERCPLFAAFDTVPAAN